MNKRIQIVVSITTFIIILTGFSILTVLTRGMIQAAITEQVEMDNKAIGEEVLNFLQSSIDDYGDNSLIDQLQTLCEEIMLPNKGFICVSQNDGKLVAAPGMKKGEDMNLDIISYEEGENRKLSSFAGFDPDSIYKGTINFENGNRTNIIASIPIGKRALRLNVHQDTEAIAQRARASVKFMLPVGFIAALLLSILGFLVVNRIIEDYESTINKQNILISKKNKEITDSIRYARYLQSSYLPSRNGFEGNVTDFFVFQKPKDIVSGDFFWVDTKNDKIYFSAIDCTGHGVPGSLLSMVSYGLLEQALHEQNIEKPSEILDYLCNKLSQTAARHESESQMSDGLDIALCSYNNKTLTLEYAGAHNPLWIVRDKKLIEYKATRKSIGGGSEIKKDCFKNNIIKVQKDDRIYLFSDGFADQFGGPSNKKFMKKRLSELLVLNSDLEMKDQHGILDSALASWMGENEQVDDILLIGITL